MRASEASVELILVLIVVRKGEFLEDDLGVNSMLKIDYQKRCPVIPLYSMCQEAGVSRGPAWNENLESLQLDWKCKTISHCNLIPLLEILQNDSLYCLMIFAAGFTVFWVPDMNLTSSFLFS